MKKILFTLLVFFLFTDSIYGQNAQVNANQDISIKYWYYRHRLINRFLKVGPHSGESIPASQLHENATVDIKWSDGTIRLGFYIGILATEYKLLKLKGENTEQTVKELYYALAAINRLDYMAEYYWGQSPGAGNDTPNLNGFFVRTDVPVDILGKRNIDLSLYNNERSYRDKYLQEEVNNYDHFLSDKTVKSTFKTELNPPDSIYKVYRDSTECSTSFNTYAEESQDQVIYLMSGLALVSRLVYEGETYNDEEFLDGETHLNQEAKNITRRIVNYIKGNSWMISNAALELNELEVLVRANHCEGECFDCGHIAVQTDNYLNWFDNHTGNKGGANVRTLAYGVAEAAGMIESFSSGNKTWASENYFLSIYPHYTTEFHDELTIRSHVLWNLFHSATAQLFLAANIIPEDNIAMNMEMILNLAAVGHSIYYKVPIPIVFPFFFDYINYTGAFINQWSKNFRFEYTAYMHDVLHSENGYGNFNYSTNLEFNTSSFLKTAPCYGPWKMNCSPDANCIESEISDDIPFGENRHGTKYYYPSILSSHAGPFKFRGNGFIDTGNSDFSDTWFNGETDGLDYMFTHNLYLLTHADKIPSNFRNMMDAKVNYEVPFEYTRGAFYEVLGSHFGSHPNLWKCYGFNSLDVSNALFKDDAWAYLRTKGDIILQDGTVFQQGAEVLFQPNYDAYDCDDNYGSVELRQEAPNEGDEGNNNSNPNQNFNSSDHKYYSLHPNPNSGQFTLTQTQEGYIKSYQLVNIMGQTLQKGTMQAGQTEKLIEISSLPKGIYILQLETTEGMKAERVVYQ